MEMELLTWKLSRGIVKALPIAGDEIVEVFLPEPGIVVEWVIGYRSEGPVTFASSSEPAIVHLSSGASATGYPLRGAQKLCPLAYGMCMYGDIIKLELVNRESVLISMVWCIMKKDRERYFDGGCYVDHPIAYKDGSACTLDEADPNAPIIPC